MMNGLLLHKQVSGVCMCFASRVNRTVYQIKFGENEKRIENNSKFLCIEDRRHELLDRQFCNNLR